MGNCNWGLSLGFALVAISPVAPVACSSGSGPPWDVDGGKGESFQGGDTGGTGPRSDTTSVQIGSDWQLDDGADIGPVVATDEHHVAFVGSVLDPEPFKKRCPERLVEGILPGAVNLGSLSVASVEDGGTATVRTVGQQVSAFGFSANARNIVYVDNYDPCSDVGTLMLASVDGTNPEVIVGPSTGVYFQFYVNTILYHSVVSDGAITSYVRLLPDGAPQLAPYAYASSRKYDFNVDGTAVVYEDFSGHVFVQDIVSGTTRPIGDANLGGRSLYWADDGQHWAFLNDAGGGGALRLSVLSRDGSTRQDFATMGVLDTPIFSPDGARIVYDELGQDGNPHLRVHPLNGDPDVHIQDALDPADYIYYVAFTKDSKTLLVATTPKGGTVSNGASAWYTSALDDGSLSYMSIVAGYDTPLSGGYVAFNPDASFNIVFPLNGAPPLTISGGDFKYEPTADHPRLLIVPPTAGTFILTASDGSTPKVYTIANGNAASPNWLGRRITYTTYNGSAQDLWILNSNGEDAIDVVSSASAIAFAPIKYPSRAFYTRATAAGGGAGGLWMATLP